MAHGLAIPSYSLNRAEAQSIHQTDEKGMLLRLNMEATVDKPEMLKYAKWMTFIIVLLTFSQASTGLSSRFGYGTASSHTMTSQLGLIICVALVVCVILSKTTDSKLKGMSFGLAFAWVVQYGLGEMLGSMKFISHIHAVVAMAIVLHAMALFRSFPTSEA